MNDFTVVTICSHIPYQDYYCIHQFATSLQDAPYLVLSPENMKDRYDGLGTKGKWLYRAIKEEMIKSEYIIFSDCWDLVFTISPSHLFETYLQWFPDKPIVISSEKNCFPADLKDEYDSLPYTSSYRYLNSGMIVGKTSDMLKILEAMDLDNVPNDYRQENGQMYHVNDQFLYQQIFLKQPVKMVLDYNQILCNTLHSVSIDELSLEPQGILNKETGRVPCAFHFNGNAKTEGLREPILKYLKLI